MVGDRLHRLVVDWLLDANLHQPLMNVLYLLVPKLRLLAISWILAQQLIVMLQVRTAAAGISVDRVKLLRRELVDLFSRELLSQFPFTIMGVQRTAAYLVPVRDDLTAVARQDFHGIAIDVAKDQVLSAARKHRHAIFLRAHCRGDRRD